MAMRDDMNIDEPSAGDDVLDFGAAEARGEMLQQCDFAARNDREIALLQHLTARSLSRNTRPIVNAAATSSASTRQGTLVSVAASAITGPATPKQARLMAP